MTPPHDLLEQYLRALRQNPNAQPPPELAHDLAAFARQLVHTSARPPQGARSRVWRRALLAQRQNGTPPQPSKEYTMTTHTATTTRPRTGYLLVAAVGILLIGFVALFANNLRRPMSEIPLNAAQSGATATMTPTVTASATHTTTPTVTASATFSPTPLPINTPTHAPFDASNMATMVSPDIVTQPLILPPTAVPIMAITPAEFIDITPYAFGAPDNQGQYSSAITSQTAAIAYRFTADRDGMVFAELKSSDMTLVGMSFAVTSADNSGGSGGGGGGSMGGSSILLVQGQTLTFGVRAGDQVEIIVGSNFGYTDIALPYTLRVILNDVIDLGAKPFEGVSENQLNGFSNPLAVYRFEAEAGEIVTIRATGVDEFDTSLDLLDSTMIPLPDFSRTSDQDSGPGYDAEIYRYALPYSGVYHVMVRPGSQGYGGFRLEISALERPSLDDGTQTIRLNTPRPTELSFIGRAGETVTINLRLPQDARDYTVDTASLVVRQGDFAIAVYELQAAMPIPESGVFLSGTVTLTADTVYIVRVSAHGVLSAPSDQAFKLEVSLARN